MVTETQKETKEMRLWTLSLTLQRYTISFIRNAELASFAGGITSLNQSISEGYYTKALQNITDIEDAIKRFRENKPQSFEE